MIANARHLTRLIDEILQFSRIDAGREEPNFQPADLAVVAREAADVARPAVLAKNLRLELSLPAAAPHPQTDASRVRQILVNLLGNACKFTDRGAILVALENGDDGVALRVSDAGIGIAPEHLERVFEPFWQVEQRAARRVGGTGLGLAVSRRLARMLGGDHAWESAPPLR